MLHGHTVTAVFRTRLLDGLKITATPGYDSKMDSKCSPQVYPEMVLDDRMLGRSRVLTWLKLT